MKIKTFLLTLILFFLISPLASAAPPPVPHLIVYKTRADYKDLVPITLSEDNSRIVSFVGPTDIYRRNPVTGKRDLLVYPTQLNQGYLLRDFLSPNKAFLDVTYEEYASLKSSSYQKFISLDMVKNKDYDPFLEMYDCGEWRSDDDVARVNNLINQGRLKKECVSQLGKPTKAVSRLGQIYFAYWFIGIIFVAVILYIIFRNFRKKKV